MGRGTHLSPLRRRKIDGDVVCTRAIDVNVKQREQTNREQDRVKRRSNVVPLLVQLKFEPLSWIPNIL